MSNLRIWGRMSSLNVRKVVWCAQELALDFQRTEAGGQFGVVKTPEYEALNPNALVPVIQDGDYVLWESNVIVRYLCAKYGAPSLATSYASRPPKGASPYLGRPGAAFYADHADARTLRLSFVTASVEQINIGVKALAEAIRSARATSAPREPEAAA